MRKLPIGIQGFEGLRKDGYLYVDKTEFIYNLVHTGKEYFLSRPRRFGKSLFLSSLQKYWEGKKELFTECRILELEADNPAAWVKHPVFLFDFNGQNYRQEGSLEVALDIHLRRWEEMYELESSGKTLGERFQNLMMKAAALTGHRCVILVDEYDKPLLEVMDNPEQEEHNKAIFKGFFSSLKGFDEYIRFVFITGVTKFEKVSIFSDLNQLNDISLVEDYSGICGITEKELLASFGPEIEETARNQHITKEICIQTLKTRYDGYHFHPYGTGVYNPFSLLKAFYDKDFGNYWFTTGTPTFLVKKLQSSGYDVRKFTDGTLYATETAVSDYRADNPDLVPLLYQTGYLTITGYDRISREFSLSYPNEEVKYGFLESLLPEYAPGSFAGHGTDIFSLKRCVERGDLEEIKNILTAIFASIPYTQERDPFEHYFQTVIYLVFTLLGHYTQCEQHTYNGRIDCKVETESFSYLFEFKRDGTTDDALKQIDAMGYDLPFTADSRKLYKIGVTFDSGKRMLNGWEVK